MSTIPAGWYPDPSNESQQRYWNGSQWTANTAPIAPAAPTASAFPAAPGQAYAHWGQRVGANLIDSLLLFPTNLIANAFLNKPLIAGCFYLISVGILIWNQVFRQGNTGYSVGKQILSIKLIAEGSGQPLGPGFAFLRQLGHIADMIACGIGYLWPLWDEKRQTFADKLIKSVVVVEPAPKK